MIQQLLVIVFVTILFQVSFSVGDDSYITKLLTDDELYYWKAPEEIKRNFTYYWSGLDDDGRPFWVGEFGKWDIRSVVERGGETFKNFDKYLDQLAARVLRSLYLTTTEENPVTEFVALADMEEYSLKQISSLPTVTYILTKVQTLIPALEKVESGYIINTNYIAERLVNLVRPILGPIFERIEVHGLNKARWIPSLLQKIPRDQLPNWYGGSPDFKPLKVYG